MVKPEYEDTWELQAPDSLEKYKEIKCRKCKEIVEIDPEEFGKGKFICPGCNTENIIEEKNIIKAVYSDGTECGVCRTEIVITNKELDERKFICPNCNCVNTVYHEKVSDTDRVFSLISHFSSIIIPFILPFIFWLIRKNKSLFTRFHSLQAAFFQLGLIVIFIFGFLMVMLNENLSHIDYVHDTEPHILNYILLLVFWIIIPFIAFVLSVKAGKKSYQGIRYKYPFIGDAIYSRVFKNNYPG
jgi:uncharacterized Tic20 family protein